MNRFVVLVVGGLVADVSVKEELMMPEAMAVCKDPSWDNRSYISAKG